MLELIFEYQDVKWIKVVQVRREWLTDVNTTLNRGVHLKYSREFSSSAGQI
jgi:hypothetical protein